MKTYLAVVLMVGTAFGQETHCYSFGSMAVCGPGKVKIPKPTGTWTCPVNSAGCVIVGEVKGNV